MLGEIQLSNPVMNASGPWASDSEQLKDIYMSQSGAVVTKTFTILPHEGNEEPNQYYDDECSINSVGLKNRGAFYFIDAVKDLGKDKPVIASIAESSSYQMGALALMLGKTAFAAIELNLSCPNIQDKAPVAFMPKKLDDYLKTVAEVATIPVGVKLPPFATQMQVAEISEILAHNEVNHIVLTNTFPMAAAFINGAPVINSRDGIGGMGGHALRRIAIANVISFRARLPEMPIVGVGGISEKDHIEEFFMAGANAVQVGTALHNNGIQKLNELAA